MSDWRNDHGTQGDLPPWVRDALGEDWSPRSPDDPPPEPPVDEPPPDPQPPARAGLARWWIVAAVVGLLVIVVPLVVIGSPAGGLVGTDPGVVPDWFGLYAGLEATASTVRCFEPQLVHGLVQTEAYARAVIGADPRIPVDVVEQRVRFRMERQRRSMDDVTLIMGEGALKLVAGSIEIMAEQMDYLRSAAADVRVLPFSAGPSPRRSGWAMLAFDSDEDPPVVYVEQGGVVRYLDKPADWADYDYIWTILMDRAVPIGEWPK